MLSTPGPCFSLPALTFNSPVQVYSAITASAVSKKWSGSKCWKASIFLPASAPSIKLAKVLCLVLGIIRLGYSVCSMAVMQYCLVFIFAGGKPLQQVKESFYGVSFVCHGKRFIVLPNQNNTFIFQKRMIGTIAD